ncbi:hypothetical protein [Mastigocoleus testarum]|uniref:Uncharacterized protein n=1 Tax=Mastigocoleus testarum BC008 TaxID=371196 RepID=A0A0V7ZH50_9CYAN|nr:hypothetical protein [Mastigocoleus testarum]KST63930.1 hypothetical protein BC008_39710 [Mastigocoleus testarum BC008]KST64640.1 hypothetical protein BC008_40685 [Mastigocoleus testarum BC008]
MKRSILFGLAVSLALIPIITNGKVLGKAEVIVQQNNQVNISQPSVLGSIETRDRQITINRNKTYTIHNKNGEVLAQDITLEELQAKNPELYNTIKDSIAGDLWMMRTNIPSDR